MKNGRVMVEQVKGKFEAMEKLLKEKEAQFRKAQDSLKPMSINTPHNQRKTSQNKDKRSIDQICKFGLPFGLPLAHYWLTFGSWLAYPWLTLGLLLAQLAYLWPTAGLPSLQTAHLWPAIPILVFVCLAHICILL